MSRTAVSKFPLVGGLFWAIKIVATTLGESVSNYVAITPLKLGYAAAVIIFLAAFALTLLMQLRADRFRPAIFWSVILMTSIVGTATSDFMNRTVGLGYTGGAAVLTTLLVIVLIGWRASGQTMDVERIATTKAEIWYWTATLLSNTLGTSSGDFLSHSVGLGFRGSSLLLSAIMLLILAAHYLTPISGTVLFWTAYVLTRPLGAVVENAVEKPKAQGGLGVGTTITSAALLAILVVLVGYQMLTHRQQTLTLDSSPPSGSPRDQRHPKPAVPIRNAGESTDRRLRPATREPRHPWLVPGAHRSRRSVGGTGRSPERQPAAQTPRGGGAPRPVSAPRASTEPTTTLSPALSGMRTPATPDHDGPRVLVVEDDDTIGCHLETGLRSNGYSSHRMRTGEGALAETARTPYDALLLDLGLPGMDSIDIARTLRARLPDLLIIILTARTEDIDVIAGLDAGADDYLVKPVSLTVLLARLRAHLRRNTTTKPAVPLYLGDLVVDTAARRCTLHGTDVPLRPKEFELLALLGHHAGQAVSRETLMADVWDENWFGSTKTLDVTMASLRRRLTEATHTASRPALLPRITTLRGHGYRLES